MTKTKAVEKAGEAKAEASKEGKSASDIPSGVSGFGEGPAHEFREEMDREFARGLVHDLAVAAGSFNAGKRSFVRPSGQNCGMSICLYAKEVSDAFREVFG